MLPLLPLLATLILFGLGIWLKLSKGKIGERRIASILSRLPADQYTTINDLILKTPNGTTQIDHVVVSVYGIFVIETKFYKGWITGGENSEYWAKNVYGNKYQFRNPILQNAGHVRALQRALPSLKIPIVPIVAFSSQARLKVNTTSTVLYWSQLPHYIRRHTTTVMSSSQMREIASTLMSMNMDSKEARNSHKQYVKDNAHMSDMKIKNGICPRCGGQITIRDGRYGRFYGCSNYPNCKFSQNI